MTSSATSMEKMQEQTRMKSTLVIAAAIIADDRFELAEEAMPLLQSEYLQLIERAEQGRQDLKRTVEIQSELDSIRTQINIIDGEIGQISSDSEVLASALGELSSYIKTDVCPVCDRDFAELGGESLSNHVHHKISNLSASAARLITLGKTRGESQQTVSSLEIELRTIDSRKTTSQAVADFDRRSASIGSAIAELQRLTPVLAEGAALRRTDVDFRRRTSELESSNTALIAARETVSEFATAIGAETLGADEGFQSALQRLAKFLNEEAERLNKRLIWRRQGLEIIGSIGPNVTRKIEIERVIAEESAQVERAERSLERAQHLREQALKIRDTVSP